MSPSAIFDEAFMVFFVILEHFKNMYVNTLTVVWSQDMWEAALFDVTDKSAIFNYAFTVLFAILENLHYMEMTDQDMLEKEKSPSALHKR